MVDVVEEAEVVEAEQRTNPLTTTTTRIIITPVTSSDFPSKKRFSGGNFSGRSDRSKEKRLSAVGKRKKSIDDEEEKREEPLPNEFKIYLRINHGKFYSFTI